MELLEEQYLALVPILAKAAAPELLLLSSRRLQTLQLQSYLRAFVGIIQSFVKAIELVAPIIIKAIFDLIKKMLKKLDDNATQFANRGLSIMEKFLKALEKNMPKIIDDSMARLVLEMIRGSDSKHAEEFEGGAAVKLIAQLLNGIANNESKLIDAGTNVIIKFIQGLSKNSVKIATAGLDAVVDFINGIADAIRTHTDELNGAGMNMATAIADGLTGGLAGKAVEVAKAGFSLGKSVLHASAKALGSHSPSKEYEKLGHYIDQGLAKGIVGGTEGVKAAYNQVHSLLRDALTSSASDIKTYEEKIKTLSKSHGKNSAEVKKYTRLLAEARSEHARAAAGLAQLNTEHKKEYDHLIRLGKRYDSYVKQLDKGRIRS